MMRKRLVRPWTNVAVATALAGVTSWAIVSGSKVDERATPVEGLSASAAVLSASVLPHRDLAETVAAGTQAMAELASPGKSDKVELPRIGAEERARLSSEMNRWATRHPEQLVEVIANLAEEQPLPLAPTFLLSIAWAETRGKILAVSPAGAAGLAQATPAAYLSEGLNGKLFVTNDYLMGTRAFIMKKPLGDALSITAPLMTNNTPAARQRALKLTASALELRQEGMDELEALRPVANENFLQRIAENDEHNLKALLELQSIIERGAPRAELQNYRTRVQRDYSYLRNLQRDGWARYAKALDERRDALLRQKYGQSATTVIMTRPYEAGEFLGRELDARFSPTEMAKFLALHLGTKQKQARELGVEEEMLDAWTAALYNGGAVNVKRMQAGLIGRLVETQKYMSMVPERNARLARLL
jgi:hypothetical protein